MARSIDAVHISVGGCLLITVHVWIANRHEGIGKTASIQPTLDLLDLQSAGGNVQRPELLDARWGRFFRLVTRFSYSNRS